MAKGYRRVGCFDLAVFHFYSISRISKKEGETFGDKPQRRVYLMIELVTKACIRGTTNMTIPSVSRPASGCLFICLCGPPTHCTHLWKKAYRYRHVRFLADVSIDAWPEAQATYSPAPECAHWACVRVAALAAQTVSPAMSHLSE